MYGLSYCTNPLVLTPEFKIKEGTTELFSEYLFLSREDFLKHIFDERRNVRYQVMRMLYTF